MSRRLRLHVAGGTYYVVQDGASRGALFTRPDDHRLFERLLAAALRRTRSSVLAYCWLPDAIHCAIRIDTAPVGRVMQASTGRYARVMQSASSEHGHFFRHRYRSVLVDPDLYLAPLARYLHYLPCLRGCAQCPQDHADSSDAAYRGTRRAPGWLDLRPVRRSIDRCDYERYMSEPPSIAERRLFENGGPGDSRVIGGNAFLASLPRAARTYRTTTTLDQVIDTVVCRLGVERDEVLSRSRRREVALARALIAWYAGERHVAPLAEVSRRLRRDPSTLSVGIVRSRARWPELFDMNSLHDLAPLAPLRAFGWHREEESAFENE